MRLTCRVPHSEAAAWTEAPAAVRQIFDRSDAVAQLDARQEKFHSFLCTELAGHLPDDDYEVTRVGDWHAGRRTTILEGGRHSVAVKVREPAIDPVLEPFVEVLSQGVGSRLRIPESRPAGQIWLQEHVVEEPQSPGSARDLGALFALSLWCGLTDLHFENLMPNRQGTALIDLECAFFTRQGLTPQRRLAMSGIVGPSGARWSGSQWFRRDGVEEVLAAFLRALELLREATTPNFYSHADRVSVRRVVLGTEIYRRFLRRRFLLGWSQERATREWSEWRARQPAPARIEHHELQALLSWDVPCFVQVGTELRTVSGELADRRTQPSQGLRRLHRTLDATDRRQKAAAHLRGLLGRDG